jgi:hypothetical protein
VFSDKHLAAVAPIGGPATDLQAHSKPFILLISRGIVKQNDSRVKPS